MRIDFDIQRASRRCHVTDRELAPGEEFFSVLMRSGPATERRDCCREAWQGPPEDAIGWWQSRQPDASASRAKLAPNEVLLELFDRWADEPGREEARYVLALLLVRRRVLRQEAAEGDAAAAEPSGTLTLYCPKRDSWHEAAVAPPDADRGAAIQAELYELLYADSQ